MNQIDLATWLATLPPSEQAALAAQWAVPSAELAQHLLDPATVQRMIAQLPEAAQAALALLKAANGTLEAHILERRFGSVRPHAGMVAPRAYLLAMSGLRSPLETLFTTGFVQRTRSSSGIVYRVPAAWLELLPALSAPPLQVLAQPPRHIVLGDPAQSEHDLAVLLALAHAAPLPLSQSGALQRPALQRLAQQLEAPDPVAEQRWPEVALLRQLALGCGLLLERDSTLRVAPHVLEWLDQPPALRLHDLLHAWIAAPSDDCVSLLGLRWRTPPLERPGAAARQALLRFIAGLPDGWISLPALLEQMQATLPDWARGRMWADWQLVAADGSLLNRWEHWPLVDGALAQAWLAGPLHWLGLIDVAGHTTPEAIRVNGWGRALLNTWALPELPAAMLHIDAAGLVSVPLAAPPLVQFQIRRVAEWRRVADNGADCLQLTSRALDWAEDRGISAAQIRSFLQRWAAAPVPPEVLALLAEWAEQRRLLRAHSAVLLTIDDPALATRLGAERRLPPHTQIDPQHWVFEPADAAAAVAALRDRGYTIAASFDAVDLPISTSDLAQLLAAAQALTTLLGPAGPAHALVERVRRALPSDARAAASRDSRLFLRALGVEREEL